jgi:hypothetical protein
LKKKTSQKEAVHKAKKNLDPKQTYKSDWLIHKECEPNAVIKPEVCSLIRENITMKGMKVLEEMETFNVLRRQIKRIKAEDPNNVKVQKKQPSKFTNNMKTELLLELDQKSRTTILEMVAFIED